MFSRQYLTDVFGGKMKEDFVTSDERAANELSVYDVLNFLRIQLWWVVGFVVVGALIGGLVSFTHPREWEASSVLQIGEVDDTLADRAPGPIDPPSRVVQRVMVEPFVDQVLSSLSLPIESAPESDLIRRSLTAEVVSNTDLVKFKVRAFSPELAKSVLQVTQSQIIATHSQIFDESVKRMRARLDGINADIAETEAKREQISSTTSVRAPVSGATDGTANALLGNMFDVQDRTLLDSMRNRRAELIQRLSPEHTFNTKPLAEVYVSRRSVSPRRLMYLLVGAVVGLVGGLLVAGTRHVRARQSGAV
jgi:uncharacterized protein involved in exopolysaccharide biosynthesis